MGSEIFKRPSVLLHSDALCLRPELVHLYVVVVYPFISQMTRFMSKGDPKTKGLAFGPVWAAKDLVTVQLAAAAIVAGPVVADLQIVLKDAWTIAISILFSRHCFSCRRHQPTLPIAAFFQARR